MKWRHLVNRLPLDNATLKLQYHSVNIFGSFRDIQQIAEWPRFLAHPVCYNNSVQDVTRGLSSETSYQMHHKNKTKCTTIW